MLKRTLEQPGNKRWEIWYIDPEGQYLGPAIQDVLKRLESVSQKWFSTLGEKADVLRILLQDEEKMEEGYWGIGTRVSPVRCYLIGYVAKALGQTDIARTYLLRAAATQSYENIADRLRADAA